MHEIQKKYQQQICELVEASNRVAMLGYVTSHGGNLSMRDGDIVIITPTKVAKRKITFDDICIVTLKGDVLYQSPGRKPTGELPFHLRIYEKRGDVRGIVHAHPPVLTGFAIAGGDVLERAFLPEPVIEVGPMVMVKYAQPLSQELADMFDDVIMRSNGFLMENHGALMCSTEGAERALDCLEMMEAQAISILVAQALGNLKTISPNDVMQLENVLRIRNMPMPGSNETVKSLADAYKLD